ncbi:rhodanese-like domain-containing protein [Aliiroseovarius sp. KMU-50]|uniref:Rhodanese-like domain-containing protein n=1 Tax=Aliiroseovarius salicola TaxID=3009082 RepID=A0ABT4VZN9_9RHOB|nr:rhodanese-like domain-containing protein [Aliiroseovarius sp. KMU-50]MDA5093727.1 rhodanese-like domain-containing protein [Aliiroseovarius sp. KMU-50]
MTSCSDTGVVENTKTTAISVEEAHRLHGRAGVEFVDPRPAEARAATTGTIPGARHISIADIEADSLPPVFADRTIHVVTTCQAGPMASQAAEAFAKLGFANVSWIKGGTQAWVDAGFETT